MFNTRLSPRSEVAIWVKDKHRPEKYITRDVSRGGLFLRASPPYEPGDRVVLNLEVPGCEVPLAVAAEVVRQEPTGAAFRFIHSTDAQRGFLDAQLSRLAG